MKKSRNQSSPTKNETIVKLKAKLDALDTGIKHDVTPAIVASFGFIIALVWRDAIRSILDKILESMGIVNKAYLYDILSAVIVTIVVIAIMIAVSSYSHSKKQKKIEKIVKEKVNEFKEKN